MNYYFVLFCFILFYFYLVDNKIEKLECLKNIMKNKKFTTDN